MKKFNVSKLGLQILPANLKIQIIIYVFTNNPHRSLIGLVVIDVEVCREDHSSIPATAIRRCLGPLIAKGRKLIPEPN
jgi:hypothetical protein